MTTKSPLLVAALVVAAGLASAQPRAEDHAPVPGLAPALVTGATDALAWTTTAGDAHRVVVATPPAAAPRIVVPDGAGSDGPPAMAGTGQDFLLVAARHRPGDSALWSRVRRGDRWLAVQQLPAVARYAYRPAIAGSTRDAWVVWIGQPAGSAAPDLWAARWDGTDWTTPQRLPRAAGDPTPATISLDDQGRPMVAWVASDGSDSEIWFSRRRRGGWSEPVAVSDNVVPDAQPAIATDARGRAVVAWASFEPDGYRPWVARERASGFRSRKLDSRTGSSPSVEGGATPRVVWAVPEGERTTRLRESRLVDGRWRRRDLDGSFHARFATAMRGDEVTVAWPREDGVRVARPGESRPRPARALSLHGPVADADRRIGGVPSLPGTWRGFGDSITVGIMTVEEESVLGVGYVPRLETTLRAFTGLEIFVTNAGAGGEVTPDGLGRLAGIMIGDPRLYTFIHEGTNDVTGIAENQDVVNNLEAMAKLVMQAGCIPFLSSLLPRPPGDSQGLNVRVDTINALLPEAALRQSAVYVDMWSAFNEQWPWFSDNVHPNEDGYQQMSDTWFASLKPILTGLAIDSDGTLDRDRDPNQRLRIRDRGATIHR